MATPSFPIVNDPVAGDALVVPIVSSATRTTLFPEATPIVSVGPDAIEVVLLRNEVIFQSQTGSVVTRDGELTIELGLAPPIAQTLDLGHIRMSVDTSRTLAIALIRHLVENHDVQLQEVLARLQAP